MGGVRNYVTSQRKWFANGLTGRRGWIREPVKVESLVMSANTAPFSISGPYTCRSTMTVYLRQLPHSECRRVNQAK